MTKTNSKQIKNLQREETRNVSNHKTANNGVNADRLENQPKNRTLAELVFNLEGKKTFLMQYAEMLFAEVEKTRWRTTEEKENVLDEISFIRENVENDSMWRTNWRTLSDKTSEGVLNRVLREDNYGNSLCENEPFQVSAMCKNFRTHKTHEETAEKKAKAKLLGELKELDFAQLLELAKASGAIK